MTVLADAKRWRYTQLEGYFQVFSEDGDVAVGVLKYKDVPFHKDISGREQISINHCVEGRAKTLKKAIDKAIKKRESVK